MNSQFYIANPSQNLESINVKTYTKAQHLSKRSLESKIEPHQPTLVGLFYREQSRKEGERICEEGVAVHSLLMQLYVQIHECTTVLVRSNLYK